MGAGRAHRVLDHGVQAFEFRFRNYESYLAEVLVVGIPAALYADVVEVCAEAVEVPVADFQVSLDGGIRVVVACCVYPECQVVR